MYETVRQREEAKWYIKQGLSMDTDDLSIPVYDGIIREAERFNHNLSIQFGVLASECKDDDDYLNQAESMVKLWLAEEEFDELIDDIFFGEYVDLDDVKSMLEKLLFNIYEIKKTPMTEREYKEW